MGTYRQLLGYPDDLPDPVLSAARALEASTIALKLTEVDTLLHSAFKDSMAETVGSIKVNYAKHILMLKLEGSRLLGQLANVTQLPLVYDRYREGPSVTSVPGLL